MEFDELKAAWAELNHRVADLEATAADARRHRLLEKSRRTIAMLGWGQFLQSLVWIGVIATVAPFWIEHRHVSHLLVAGLVLHAYGILVVSSSVIQILLVTRAYYTAPVVSFQRQLAELRRLRIVGGLAIGLPWWVLWVPATMIGARLFWGIDLYAQSSGWIFASLGFGLAGIGVSVLVARRLATRPPSSGCWRSAIDDIAGHSLTRASRQLEEIAAFDRE